MRDEAEALTRESKVEHAQLKIKLGYDLNAIEYLLLWSLDNEKERKEK